MSEVILKHIHHKKNVVRISAAQEMVTKFLAIHVNWYRKGRLGGRIGWYGSILFY
jgi:hypothetical protein